MFLCDLLLTGASLDSAAGGNTVTVCVSTSLIFSKLTTGCAPFIVKEKWLTSCMGKQGGRDLGNAQYLPFSSVHVTEHAPHRHVPSTVHLHRADLFVVNRVVRGNNYLD